MELSFYPYLHINTRTVCFHRITWLGLRFKKTVLGKRILNAKTCDRLEATNFFHLELRWNETVENLWQSILLSQYPMRTNGEMSYSLVTQFKIEIRIFRLHKFTKYPRSSVFELLIPHWIIRVNKLFDKFFGTHIM